MDTGLLVAIKKEITFQYFDAYVTSFIHESQICKSQTMRQLRENYETTIKLLSRRKVSFLFNLILKHLPFFTSRESTNLNFEGLNLFSALLKDRYCYKFYRYFIFVSTFYYCIV